MAFVCPYFRSYNAKTKTVNCSGHKLRFRNRIDRLEYTGRYCGCVEGWSGCTLAREHIKREAREEEQHG